MRRTRKWSFVAQEATRLAELGLSPLEIATRLGVNKSTVTRWMASGKLNRTTGRPNVAAPGLATRPGQTPAEWAQAVRTEYDLDATDDQLVTIAESALALSLDIRVSPQVRMTAAGRFQALLRQLALVARNAAPVVEQPTSEPKRSDRPRAVRRSGVDPRSLLTAVK